MKTQFMTLSLIALFAIGCNSNKKEKSDTSETKAEITSEATENVDDTTIENTKWIITTLEGQDMTDKEKNGQEIYFTLNPVGNRISGNSGCNTFMGNYTLEEGNRISFSQLGSTRMTCPDAKINESEILKVFETADNFTISGDKLMLNKAKRAPLAIFKKAEMNNEPITEKYWKLKTLEGQEVEMAENQEREQHFILKTDENRVTGFAGCNNLSGEYTLEEGNRIRFSNIAVNMKACPDVDVNEQEFLEVFNLTDNYTIQGDTLSLNVGRRAPLAVFEAVYFD